MNVFSESELRLKFLQARDVWLQSCLNNIPKEDGKNTTCFLFMVILTVIAIAANHHLYKTIEITRVNLFNIVTQYRAVFNDDDHGPLMSIKSSTVNQNVIFFSWINDKVRSTKITS